MANNVGDLEDVVGTGCDPEVEVDIGDFEFGATGDCADSFISVASDCGTTARENAGDGAANGDKPDCVTSLSLIP